jgi:cystathionine gamma-lyase
VSTDLDRLWADLLHPAHDLKVGDPLGAAIVPTSQFHLPGDPTCQRAYGRFANPTWSLLETALSSLEGAPALSLPSGMAAVAAGIIPHVKSGDRIVLPSDGYYTSRLLAQNYLEPLGVVAEFCATADYATRDFTGVRIVFAETPSNPALALCPLAEIARRAHAAGGLFVVDNTTMTPFGQRPLELGADIVVSSDTKAVNGHSDVLFGHVATNDADLFEAMAAWRKIIGVTPGTFEAWMVLRGLQTLELRFARMCDSADAIAPRFAAHPKVKAVVFPGLPSHPDHALAKAQMTRFGFLVGVTLADEAAAERFISEAKYLVAATSFGGLHSSAERRARWGDAVDEGFVRISIGCEPTEILWAEFARALDGI